MPDDHGLIDLLQTPKKTESGSDESAPEPERRSSGEAFLIALVFIVVIGVLFSNLRYRPGGIPIFAIVVYSFTIPYIASDRFLSPVPWKALTRGRFLLVHCLALAIVYGLTTWALAVKPSLPGWFITAGRRGSLFDWCLYATLLILAFCECFWGSKYKDEQTMGNPGN